MGVVVVGSPGRVVPGSDAVVVGTVADTVVDGSVADTVVEGSDAETVVEGTVADTVAEGTVAATVVDGSVADTVADGSVAETVVPGVVAATVVDGSVADTFVADTLVDGRGDVTVSRGAFGGDAIDAPGGWAIPGAVDDVTLENAVPATRVGEELGAPVPEGCAGDPGDVRSFVPAARPENEPRSGVFEMLAPATHELTSLPCPPPKTEVATSAVASTDCADGSDSAWLTA